MRSVCLLFAAALAVGCDRKGTADAPERTAGPVVVREQIMPPLSTEEGTLFWFNSRVISEAGNNLYGKYAYSKLLPLLSPSRQKNPEAWFVALDGDYLGAVKLPTTGADEEKVLEEVERIGRSLCYIIAVYGRPALAYSEMDRTLREGKTTGYLGRTTAPGYEGEKFLRLCSAAALPIAFRIDGARLKKISFDFFGDGELQAFGFEPYRAK